MEKITFREKLGYGFGDMASSMFWKIFGMYLLFFYTKVFGISPAAAGTMFLLTRIWDAVNDPIMGLLSDRTQTRWGKYRPYLLWGGIPFALIGIMTFFTPDWGENAKLAYAYVTYTLMMMIYTVVNVPYASLLGVMSPHPRDRNTLSSYRMFFAYVGSFITFMILQPLVDAFSSGSSRGDQISTEPGAWTAAVAVIGLLCALLFFLCFRWTKERVKAADETRNKASVGTDLKRLFTNRPWWILLASGISALLFNSIRDGVALFYFTDYVTSTFRTAAFGWTVGTIYLLVGQASNMIGVALAAPVANRIGKKKTYLGAMILAALLSCFFFMLKPDQIMLIMIFQVVISACAGIIFPLLWSMYADIVDYQELKTGRRATGLILSSSSMSQKFGWAVGGAITGWLLAAFGYDADLAVQSQNAVHGVRLMMSFLPAIGCILAVIAIALYPLGEKKVLEITAQLNEKRDLYGKS
ncbi:MAG: MFS transporter [Bacteroidales bacterium]|jgi:GPH family glycoside/pentoside/hexuronide:cation symporter|nr:MFS transporter [Bacteroidales bacterium]MDD3100117.1 MFS transporter [Bacteroidales bacterium]MDD3638983.1 MFS transporter [Bacteroidales bacterium]MDD3943548.1 MFS transporter [Bacteroidales bacterium]MDD4480277.1 MFS transporter [Bacteroidales bacterium]